MDVIGLAGLPDERNCGTAPMGAALTYARRYALFTLVGIAGEDDLDAPDLAKLNGAEPTNSGVPDLSQTNGHAKSSAPFNNHNRGSKRDIIAAKPVLASNESAVLREQLLAEMVGLASTDQVDSWVVRSLPAKNSLTAADAVAVEAAFRAKSSALTDNDDRVGAQTATVDSSL